MNNLTAETLFLNESFRELESLEPRTLLDIFLETINIDFQAYIAETLLTAQTDKIPAEYKGCLLAFLLKKKDHDSTNSIKRFFTDVNISEKLLKHFYRVYFLNNRLRKTVDINTILDVDRELSSSSDLTNERIFELLHDSSQSVIKRVEIAQSSKLSDIDFLYEELHEYLQSLSMYELVMLQKRPRWPMFPSLTRNFLDEAGYELGTRRMNYLLEEKENDTILALLLYRAGIIAPCYLPAQIDSMSSMKKYVFYLENSNHDYAISCLFNDKQISDEIKINAYYRIEWHTCERHIFSLLKNISMENAFKLFCRRRMDFYGHYEKSIFSNMRNRILHPERFGRQEPNIVQWFDKLDTQTKNNIFTGASIEVKKLLLGIA